MNSNPKKILIAGGGIGGLMAAQTLVQSGFAVHVLERAARFAEVGAGLQLGPNATWILNKWNLFDLVEMHLVTPDEIRIMDAVSDEQIGRVPLGAVFLQRFGTPYAVAHRADLHKALLQACIAQPMIDLETGQTVTGYEETGDGIVVRTENGARIEGDALIGADGIWSTIRRQMFRDAAPEFAGHVAYRALIDPEAMPAECAWNASTLWAGPDTHLVHYPVGAGSKFNIVAVTASTWRGENWNATADTEEVLEAFSRSCPRVKTILGSADGYHKWALADLPPLQSWSRGRVTLLGDAAHAVLPYLAQGAAMAIEDANQLADSLARTDGHFESAFVHYQNARQPRTTRMHKESRFNGSVYHATGIKRAIRNQIMKRLTPESWYKRVEWIYQAPKG